MPRMPITVPFTRAELAMQRNTAGIVGSRYAPGTGSQPMLSLGMARVSSGGNAGAPGEPFDFNTQQLMLREKEREQMAPLMLQLEQERERRSHEAMLAQARMEADWMSGGRQLQAQAGQGDADRALRAFLQSQELGYRGQESEQDRAIRQRLAELGESGADRRLDKSHVYGRENLITQLDRTDERAELDRIQQERLRQMDYGHTINRDQILDELQHDRDARTHGYSVDLLGAQDGFRQDQEVRQWQRQDELQLLAEREQAMQAEQQAIQEGLRSGELYYTPQQKQDLARINDAVARLPLRDDMTLEQKSQAMAQLQARKQAIRPLERPADERPTSVAELFQSKLHWDNDGTPWTADKEGQLQVPRGWSPKKQGAVEPAMQEMDVKNYDAELDRWLKIDEKRNAFIEKRLSMFGADGSPLFEQESVLADADRIFGQSQMPMRPDQRQAQREQDLRSQFQQAIVAVYQGQSVPPEVIQQLTETAKKYGLDPTVIAEEEEVRFGELLQNEAEMRLRDSWTSGGAAVNPPQPGQQAVMPGQSQSPPPVQPPQSPAMGTGDFPEGSFESPTQRTWNQFFNERLGNIPQNPSPNMNFGAAGASPQQPQQPQKPPPTFDEIAVQVHDQFAEIPDDKRGREWARSFAIFMQKHQELLLDPKFEDMRKQAEGILKNAN
jgi:hypothetical protein